MKELIKITENNGVKAVSARELHQFLQNKDRFSKWFERMKSYGFVENIDFQGCELYHTQANQELTDYVLSIDCAKEIAMLQKSEKGKLARLYFIEMEKKAKGIPTLPKVSEDQAYTELTSLIRKHLQRGDIRDIAKTTGLGEKTLGLVSKGMKAKPQFVQALYQRALENKKTGRVIDIHQMINNLK